ncbi:hypothetical protein INT47_009000 [Mucor saturninus]|uniref:NmrA-like domain-containing protein n=1 Tax=Mucor saturninus TaxID=64648 RepID=A0A8H7QTD4_9FUNG|nr:hypothetical protein INT47_009000 [Mucor saturninus]
MKQAIVITNVDSLLGYALAYRFLEDWNRSNDKDKTEFRLACCKNEGLHDLERLGGQIYEMGDYGDEDAMHHLMKNVIYVLFVPTNTQNRMKEGEAVLKSAHKEKVDYLAMFSFLGLDGLEGLEENKMKHLNQMLQLEKKVPEHFDKKSYCIIQSAIWSQFFYFFGPMIEDNNEIRLTVHKKAKWGTIDLGDLVDAVYNLSDPSGVEQTGKESLGQLYVSNLKKKNCTLFQFTPRHNFSAEQLVHDASQGLEREDMTYEKTDASRLKDYLRGIQNDNRFRERPHHHTVDRPYTFPLGRYLKKGVIETLMEYLDFIDKGKADIETNQLADALGRDPQDVRHFFKDNRDQFRHLR